MATKEYIENEIKSGNPASYDLLYAMLSNIGIPDSDLRDDVISRSWKLLLEEGRVSEPQKTFLLDAVLEKKLLFLGVDQAESEKTLTRSFASLLLAALLEDHADNPWLTEEQQADLIQTGLRYMNLEQDTRGFVEECGWVHAFAHGADMLKQLVRLETLTHEDALKVLQTLEHALLEVGEFNFGEEGRLAGVAIQLLKEKTISDLNLADWLKTCRKNVEEKGLYNVWWLNFLKSFYLMMELDDLVYNDAKELMKDELKKAYQKYKVI